MAWKRKNRRLGKKANKAKTPSMITNHVPATFRRKRARVPSLISAELAWYAIRTNIKCEGRAMRGLSAAKIAHYMPTDLVERVTRKNVRVEKLPPAMPRYMFVGFQRDNLAFGTVRAIDGVESFVGIQGKPYPIPAQILQAIEDGLCEGYTPTIKGQRAIITGGPLEGFYVTVKEHLVNNRVRAMIDMFGMAELDVDKIGIIPQVA
jgi:transcription antitermination factor NusG